MSTTCDVVVIGAGPAGLAAATQAAELGLKTVLLDEQAAPGGQIYRAVERPRSPVLASALGDTYTEGAPLVASFRKSGCDYRPGMKVWQIDPDGRVFVSDGERANVVAASQVIIAIGALERPVPIRGWTLPGVMTVGAAQTLLKGSGFVPQEDVWIAGSGPLVWLYAAQLVAAGVRPAGLLDTANPAAKWAALRHAGGAWAGRALIGRGLDYRRTVFDSGIRVVSGVEDIEAHGDGRVDRIRYLVNGSWHKVAAGGLLLHEGVIPNAHMAMSCGVAHEWDARQQCHRPRRDAFGRTSVERVAVAGDCGGILGADAAVLQGRLAALGAARALDRMSEADLGSLAAPLQSALAPLESFRQFIDTLFPPRAALLVPKDDVIVCRCESVTAGAIRAAVRTGCLGANQVKAYTRCGMGPCQGRTCSSVLTATIAADRGVSPAEVEPMRIRPPLKPLTLGELATLAQGEVDG
jgi:NADPH-dependent 2,4-dienoyl-CoA reductase/sulfur reductase-like enzyme